MAGGTIGKRGGAATQGGFSLTRPHEFRAWRSMKKRCSPSAGAHHRKYYFDRGIGVCERWRASYLAFFDDVGPAPGPEYTLDRIDPTRGYEPGNVRWATRSTQTKNRHPLAKVARPWLGWKRPSVRMTKKEILDGQAAR